MHCRQFLADNVDIIQHVPTMLLKLSINTDHLRDCILALKESFLATHGEVMAMTLFLNHRNISYYYLNNRIYHIIIQEIIHVSYLQLQRTVIWNGPDRPLLLKNVSLAMG